MFIIDTFCNFISLVGFHDSPTFIKYLKKIIFVML